MDKFQNNLPLHHQERLEPGGSVPATLQVLGHEEGRIRYNSSSKVFNWDYFLRDHLGNVRMVLTEEQKTTAYPAATMEDALASTEQALYANLPETRSSLPGGYPVDNSYSDPNLKAARVNGNGQKIGPSITLKVMAGDKFHVRVSSWYRTVSGVPSTTSSPLTQLINALSAGMAPLSGGKVSSPELSSSSLFTGEATKFLESQDNYTTTKPKAFLNWILFDEQFNMVASSSGFEQVPEESVYSNTTTPKVYNHVKTNLPVHKNGYLYIYVSNETQGLDLFFDNLQVTHIAGPVVEETHYYPFGLTMAGISSKALGKLENKYKFNEGTELANKEFNDGSGLEWYETNYRGLDPQIGRFMQIDPLSNLAFHHSTYSYASNNPMLLNDPLGLLSTPENPEVLPEVVITPRNNRNKSFQWFGWSSTVNLNFNGSLNKYSQRREAGENTVKSTDPSWYKEDVQQFNMESWHQNRMTAREFEKGFYLAYGSAFALPFLAPEIAAAMPGIIGTKAAISFSAQAVTGGVDNIDVVGVASDALLAPGSGALINGAMSWRPFSDNPTFSLVGQNKTYTQAGIDFTTSFLGGKIGGLVGSNLPPLQGAFERNLVDFSIGVPNTFSMQIANTILTQKLSTQRNEK